ncbi:MAG: hypothetical protein ACRDXE_00605 [Acidimicrobiales bacterium]
MTLTDYLIDIALIAVVVLQVRGRRLTARSLLLPVVLVGWAASSYLHGIPTAGNDLVLAVAGAVAGTTLGILCALSTTVKLNAAGQLVAQAGAVAGTLWVVGVGTRFAFQLYASHGGAAAIGHFSAAHAITTSEAWVATLILMAMGEALARTAVLALRAYALSPSHVAFGTSIMGAGDRLH